MTGYWSDHLYTRRSVERDVLKFEGWRRLKDLVDSADEPWHGALMATLFEVGGRISEVVRSKRGGLKKDHFMVKKDEGLLIVQNMLVLKRHKRFDKYVDQEGRTRWHTKPIDHYRVIPIPLAEPLVPYMLEYLKRFRGDYLFPITRVRAYQIITKLDDTIWPHWFRAQRASQLAVEYGWRYEELLEFFSWKDLETAARYAKMGYKVLSSKFPKSVARMW